MGLVLRKIQSYPHVKDEDGSVLVGDEGDLNESQIFGLFDNHVAEAEGGSSFVSLVCIRHSFGTEKTRG